MESEVIYCEKYGANGLPVTYIKEDGCGLTVHDSSLHVKHNYFHQAARYLREIFLPQGYPESVRDDYASYQIWDTVQASCSTISGTMTTHAIMQGVGVGDSAATALSATITWIMKDGVGMVGGIVFAWWKGHGLDADCKKWRLCADFLNDAAMSLELLLLPIFPQSSTQILCVTSGMKAIVGVAGGASRAAITQHHAVRGNMGDVSAKDGSQETCVNLVASMLGVLVLSLTQHTLTLWVLFSIVTALHMYANYRAVKALKLVTFNSERLAIFLKRYLTADVALTPQEVNASESVIVGCGYSDIKLCGFSIKLGYSLQQVVSSQVISCDRMKELCDRFHLHPYMVVPNVKDRCVYITFAPDETTKDVLRAYFHAVLEAICICIQNNIPLDILESSNIEKRSIISKLKMLQKDVAQSVERVKDEADLFVNSLQSKGWSSENHHLPVDEWRGTWSNLKQSKKNL